MACGARSGTKITLFSPVTAANPERELAAFPVEEQATTSRPRSSALATPTALAEFEARRAELEKAAADKLAAAQAIADKLEGIVLTIARKASVDGRLFGSVTNYDVAEALQVQGFEVEKSAIRMPEGPLKATGETALEVALHTDVLANVKVQVVGE